jgi:uncharacterized protein with PQ loop repeat
MLFLVFFPKQPQTDLTSSTASLSSSAPAKIRDAVIVGVATLVTLLAVGITSVVLVASFPQYTQNWADLLGSASGLMAMVQYLPQIYETWRLGDVKSLSIVTMLIQVPGAFLFAFSLWLRVSWEGWSTWLTYIVTGTLQGVLLGLAIGYYLRAKKAGKLEEERDEISGDADDVDGLDGTLDQSEPHERTRLLKNRPKLSAPRDAAGNTHRSSTSNRQFNMLYAATPPENDSDRSSSGRG